MSYVENGIGQLAWTAKSFTPNIKGSKIKLNTIDNSTIHIRRSKPSKMRKGKTQGVTGGISKD